MCIRDSLYTLEDTQGPAGLLWVACDLCNKWRLVDAETHARVDAEGTFRCEEDRQRPIRGCDVALHPASAEPPDDETFMRDAHRLLPPLQ